MLSKTSILMALVFAGGCYIDDDSGKNACMVPDDCLSGYECINQRCVGGGGGSGDDDGGGIHIPDAPSAYYGTVEALTPASSGLTAVNYDTIAGVTNAPGTLGCAVVGDLTASPGAGAAVVYAKVSKESGDTRCPTGVYAIVNDPAGCRSTFPDELRSSCAVYKRWDASGTQVAYQSATGGYVSIQDTYVSETSQRCVTEVSIRFAGGVTVAKTYQFTYNPLAPTSAFCTH